MVQTAIQTGTASEQDWLNASNQIAAGCTNNGLSDLIGHETIVSARQTISAIR